MEKLYKFKSVSKKFKDSFDFHLDELDDEVLKEKSDALDLAESNVQVNTEASKSTDDPDNQTIDIDNSRLANIDKDENYLNDLKEKVDEKYYNKNDNAKSDNDKADEINESYGNYSKHVDDPSSDQDDINGDDYDDDEDNFIKSTTKQFESVTSDQRMIHAIVASANNGNPNEVKEYDRLLTNAQKLEFVVVKRQTLLTNPYGLYGIVPLNNDFTDKYPRNSLSYYVRDEYSQKIITEKPGQSINDFINSLSKAGLNILNNNSSSDIWDEAGIKGGFKAVIKRYNTLNNKANLSSDEYNELKNLNKYLNIFNNRNKSNRSSEEINTMVENVKHTRFAKLFENNNYRVELIPLSRFLATNFVDSKSIKDAYSDDNSEIEWESNHTNLKYMAEAIQYLENRLEGSYKTKNDISFRIETYTPNRPNVTENPSKDYPDYPEFKYTDDRNYIDIKIYTYNNRKYQISDYLQWNNQSFEFDPKSFSNYDDVELEFINEICKKLNFAFEYLKNYKLDENLGCSVEIKSDGTIHVEFKYKYITPVEDNRSELARSIGFSSMVTQAPSSDSNLRKYGLKGYLAKQFKTVLETSNKLKNENSIKKLDELYKLNPLFILEYSNRMKDIIDKTDFENLLLEFKSDYYNKDKLDLSNDEIYKYPSLKERARDINNDKAYIQVWYKFNKNMLQSAIIDQSWKINVPSKRGTNSYDVTMKAIESKIKLINSSVENFSNIFPSINSNKTDAQNKNDPNTHIHVITRAKNAINKVIANVPSGEYKSFDENLYDPNNAKEIFNPALEKYVKLYSLAYNSYMNTYNTQETKRITSKIIASHSTGEKLNLKDLKIEGRAISYIYGFLKYVLNSNKDLSDDEFEKYVLNLATENGKGIPSVLNLINLGLEYNANRKDLKVDVKTPNATLSRSHLNEICEVYKTLNDESKDTNTTIETFNVKKMDDKINGYIDTIKAENDLIWNNKDPNELSGNELNEYIDDMSKLRDDIKNYEKAKEVFHNYYDNIVDLIKHPDELGLPYDYSCKLTPLRSDYEVAMCKDQIVELALPIKYNNKNIVAFAIKIYARGQQDKDLSNLSFDSTESKLHIPGLQNIDVDLGLNRSAEYNHMETIYANQYTISNAIDLLKSLKISKISISDSEVVDATKDNLKMALIDFMKANAKGYQYYTNMEMPTLVITINKVNVNEKDSVYNLLIDEATAKLDFPTSTRSTSKYLKRII